MKTYHIYFRWVKTSPTDVGMVVAKGYSPSDAIKGWIDGIDDVEILYKTRGPGWAFAAVYDPGEEYEEFGFFLAVEVER